jgi:hypothetical protein
MSEAEREHSRSYSFPAARRQCVPFIGRADRHMRVRSKRATRQSRTLIRPFGSPPEAGCAAVSRGEKENLCRVFYQSKSHAAMTVHGLRCLLARILSEVGGKRNHRQANVSDACGPSDQGNYRSARSFAASHRFGVSLFAGLHIALQNRCCLGPATGLVCARRNDAVCGTPGLLRLARWRGLRTVQEFL